MTVAPQSIQYGTRSFRCHSVGSATFACSVGIFTEVISLAVPMVSANTNRLHSTKVSIALVCALNSSMSRTGEVNRHRARTKEESRWLVWFETGSLAFGPLITQFPVRRIEICVSDSIVRGGLPTRAWEARSQ